MTTPQIPGYPGQQHAHIAAIPGYPGAPPAPVGVPGPIPAGVAYAPPAASYHAPPANLPPPVQAAPAPAYAPLPQGYPGPAVPAPQYAPPPPPPAYAAPPPAPPAYAPPPAAYAPPAPAYAAPTAPPPGYGVPQPAYGQHAAPVDVGAIIAAATGGDGPPIPREGTFDLEIVETIVTVHPKEFKKTFKGILKVLSSNNPSHPPGSEVAYIEGLAWGAGRAQDFICCALGYPSKAAYDHAYAAAGYSPEQSTAELAKVAQAAASPDTTPLKGRRIRGAVGTVTKTAGARSAKAGQQVTYTNWTWTPLA